jgi:predicted N-acetyltransferase YhbS
VGRVFLELHLIPLKVAGALVQQTLERAAATRYAGQSVQGRHDFFPRALWRRGDPGRRVFFCH